ncbi:endonuclease NucS domain-containing protein [Mycobacterium sp.]|uniref:endonuclease NucS domain-containing protein n=1 Tax=Mycobacterium sp. TaxID=1785 RepID=UPI0025CEDA87|nr:endonuclease NucS domain-containing protein [Mycobacterium sp.]
MAMEMELWRVDDGKPIRLVSTGMPLESQLETLIETDSSLLGQDLLIIGRQVATSYQKFIDLLAVDAEGTVHILELKKDKTPREVVAQLLDYGSWVQGLSNDDIRHIYEEKNPGSAFDAAFADRFGAAPPDEINNVHTLTVVASSLDASTERIVSYLHDIHGLPINVVFFRYYEDGHQKYLARTYLRPESVEVAPTPNAKSKTETWDGHSWYVSYGAYVGGRSWLDARKYGFVAAGGGLWYSRTLVKLPVGARVFVFLPGPPNGRYVGVGTVTGSAQPAESATIEIGGETTPFTDLEVEGVYTHPETDDPDNREWIVPVDWEHTVSGDDGIWRTGFFANQNSACKLRNKFTIETLLKDFDLTD